MNGIRSIFVTNNGLSDHIGTAQVLPYLEGLAARGHQIACLSVEHPTRQEEFATRIAPRLERAGIEHSPILRHTLPLAGKLERFAIPGLMQSRLEKLIETFQPDLIHCRSYMPLGAVLPVSLRRGLPFVFDMRGFWVDERCEAGIWQGPVGRSIARHFRKLETRAISKASAIVALTHDAKSIVAARRPSAGLATSVVPCSVDQSKFLPDKALRASTRRELGYSTKDVVLVHLGSAGPLYQMGTTYRLLAALQAQDMQARLLLVGDHSIDQHVQAARGYGVTLDPAHLTCKRVPHDDVPALLNAADIGLSFRIASKSSLGVSATKVGEYLSCGLPVISNTGIGDINDILPDRSFGLVLARHDSPAIEHAARTIASAPFAPRSVIRTHATGRFSLERACEAYDALYRTFGMERQAA
ncbi:glycosyltransferase [Aliiroseovarius sp. F47248L]|uniref:glycosyltransferase n=1 Tax=Aliiroseovarius sp. F47248L TaxID=2926420 RepID=UPI001FF48370|nr:glycosyltransferase [Aliiroseovarius sp. F47248L]MCK0139993.1 glycosyltransferase [Aliiroseovarius sp. F47248L]